MKIFRNAFLIAAALVLGMTSCKNDGDLPEVNGGQDKIMAFTISGVSSRFVGPEVANDAPVEFLEGVLLLTDASGNVVRWFTITDAASDFNTTGELPTTNGQNINIADARLPLTNPNHVILERIPASVVRATIIGNSNDDLAIPAVGTPWVGGIGAIVGTSIDVTDQLIVAGTNGVNLYAANVLTTNGTVNSDGHELYQVALHLRPTLARVELTDIQIGGHPDGYDTQIVSLDVTGIFVDRYFRTATVQGANVTPTSWVNHSDIGQSSNWTAGSSWFPAVLNPSIYDVVGQSVGDPASDDVIDSIGESITPIPTVPGNVWGYNVFANADVPYLVIRFDNVRINVPTYNVDGIIIDQEVQDLGTRFLVVNGFRNQATGQVLTQFTAGEVYRINAGGLVFDERHFVIDPNVTEFDLEVTVTVATWQVIVVDPIH